MDFTEMRERGREVRRRYAQDEARRYGRSWTPEEIMLGFLGDVGDLAKLVQGKAGVRAREDLDAALAHELADCLWSVMVLADCYDVDLADAFSTTMADLSEHLRARGAESSGDRRPARAEQAAACEDGRVHPTRLISLDDVPVLAELLQVNRDFLAPWEPVRGDDFFSVEGQRDVVGAALAQYEQGSTLPHVILDGGRVVGRISLNTIVRGLFQSCSLGYWVGADSNGRGLATAAVRDIIRVAFEELGLHRIEASTLLHNGGSQRVLERNGFVRFGVAPTYLNIAGEWQDMALYQVVSTATA